MGLRSGSEIQYLARHITRSRHYVAYRLWWSDSARQRRRRERLLDYLDSWREERHVGSICYMSPKYHDGCDEMWRFIPVSTPQRPWALEIPSC